VQESIVVPYIAGHTSGLVVSQWRLAVGDPVRAGAPLVELDSESAIIQVTATADGVLLACHAAEGELVEVGDVLGILDVGIEHTAPPSLLVQSPAAAEPTWEVRTFDVTLGDTAVALDAGWKPFAVLGPHQVVARRRR